MGEFQERCSDRDREMAADRLRAALASGELDQGEFAERIAAAFAARTRGELPRVVGDLRPIVSHAQEPPGVGLAFNVFGSSVTCPRRSRVLVVNVFGTTRVDLSGAPGVPRHLVIVNLFGTTKLVAAPGDQVVLGGISVFGSRLRTRTTAQSGRVVVATAVSLFGAVRATARRR